MIIIRMTNYNLLITTTNDNSNDKTNTNPENQRRLATSKGGPKIPAQPISPRPVTHAARPG